MGENASNGSVRSRAASSLDQIYRCVPGSNPSGGYITILAMLRKENLENTKSK